MTGSSQVLRFGFALLILNSCGHTSNLSDGYSMLVPVGLSLQDRTRNVQECRDAANLQAWKGPPLTEEQKAPLKGRSTIKFFFQGLAVVDKEMTPSIYKTWVDPPLGYTVPEVSDRYVLCLLSRGYTWPYGEK